jgi:hypothetical protein
VGALVGGRASQALGQRETAVLGAVLASVGLALMSRWHTTSLGHPGATVALVLAGFGFGLTIAPINASVLNATASTVHGLASALVVVSRTVGMLVGLSALTAVGLSRFAHATAGIASPFQLCPATPAHCSTYNAAVRHAAVAEVHTVFAGAAVAAALAALLAGLLLRRRTGAPTPAAPEGASP